MPKSSTGQSDVFRHLVMTPQALAGYLTKAGLLCFISDKNLGIVVTTQDWYWEQVKKFIELPVFESFIGVFASFREDVGRRIWELSSNNQDIEFWISPKVQKFLEQYTERNDIPKFHGIPKIHKNPWKIRPIVPMHSYVTSTISIVVHHLLLPIQRSFSWICDACNDAPRTLVIGSGSRYRENRHLYGIVEDRRWCVDRKDAASPGRSDYF